MIQKSRKESEPIGGFFEQLLNRPKAFHRFETSRWGSKKSPAPLNQDLPLGGNFLSWNSRVEPNSNGCEMLESELVSPDVFSP